MTRGFLFSAIRAKTGAGHATAKNPALDANAPGDFDDGVEFRATDLVIVTQ